MKFPLSWLKEYIRIELPPHEIAKILTMMGIEVDSIQRAELSFDKVIVGKVIEVSPHPNADKLSVAQVTDGVEKYQVVCGAPNCRSGMKTAFAQIGASITFPDGEKLKIKRSKIRGVESFGMLCSGSELGISLDEEGIIEFADHIQVGADVGEIYSDVIFEVSLTPNMNHAGSLIGIARELSAATGIPLNLPLVYVKEDDERASSDVSVEIKEPEDCPLYACRVLDGLEHLTSPDWLKKRLTACGIRPTFAPADVANYVLLEMGQPLHAFDLDAISGKKIIVSHAHSGESIKTLDGKERKLSAEMLMIRDSHVPLAIGGVIGGASSEVKETTKRVLIESAYFRPASVRKASKTLGVSTDASRRFERAVDPQGVLVALDRAAMLIQEITGAKALKGPIKKQSPESKVFDERVIVLRQAKVNALLGTKLGLSEIETFLLRLSFKTEGDGSGQQTLTVKVPSFRTDVACEEDLIEEVARLVGYDNIPRHAACYHASTVPENSLFHFEREVRQRLIGEGLQEFLTCDLIGPSLLDIAPDPKTPRDAVINVLNPTSIEQSVLRTSLLQGLLQVVKFNRDHESENIAGFEVGRVHFRLEGQYQEPSVAAIVLSGQARPYHIDPKPRDADFYDLKGMIENLLEGLNIRRYSFRFSHIDTFHPGRQALIQVDGIDVGSLGEIHPSIQRRLDVDKRVYFAEVNLNDLLKAKRGDLKLKSIPEYPSSCRDWTVTVPEEMAVHQLVGSIERIPSKLLEEVSLGDIFRSERLGQGKKNVTLHFVYRDKAKTVSQEEVDQEHARIIAAAEAHAYSERSSKLGV